MLIPPDPPKWAEEILRESEDYFGYMTKAITHPVETLEAMTQNLNDTYEVEGLEYMGGYVIGDIVVGELSAAAVSKAVGKGAGAVDDIGNIANKADDVADIAETAGKMDDIAEIAETAGSYSGDLMSVEDAARYSEYWRELGIGSDKTWDEFIKANPNKSIDDYFKIIKEQSPWPDGYNPNNNIIILKEGDTFNMVLDIKQKVTQPSGFGLIDDVPSIDFARNDMAIKIGWKDDCGKVVTYRIKQGVELEVPSGPIGPQIDLGVDTYLPGNESLTQLDLFNRLGKINRNDYIEVVPGSVRRLH